VGRVGDPAGCVAVACKLSRFQIGKNVDRRIHFVHRRDQRLDHPAALGGPQYEHDLASFAGTKRQNRAQAADRIEDRTFVADELSIRIECAWPRCASPATDEPLSIRLELHTAVVGFDIQEQAMKCPVFRILCATWPSAGQDRTFARPKLRLDKQLGKRRVIGVGLAAGEANAQVWGVAAMEKRNIAKSQLLYGAIDRSQLYVNRVGKDCRSRMNVPFFLRDESRNEAFLAGAKTRGLLQLKGHKSVGGMRASIYNAMPLAGVAALVDYMQEFEKKHA